LENTCSSYPVVLPVLRQKDVVPDKFTSSPNDLAEQQNAGRPPRQPSSAHGRSAAPCPRVVWRRLAGQKKKPQPGLSITAPGEDGEGAGRSGFAFRKQSVDVFPAENPLPARTDAVGLQFATFAPALNGADMNAKKPGDLPGGKHCTNSFVVRHRRAFTSLFWQPSEAWSSDRSSARRRHPATRP